MRRSEAKSKSKSGRKPFRDISNRRIGSYKSAKKTKPKSEKDDRIGSGDTIDRLLLVHSDVSDLFRQIDELAVQAVKSDETDKQRRKGIESFTCILSDMLFSLKPWVPKLQKAVSVTKKPTKFDCSDKNLQSPEPSKMESLVSPSPLVSWRATDCTIEEGKQLFALTPLPRLKTAFAKGGQSLSKSVALQRFNSSAAVFPSCFGKTESIASKKDQSLFKKQPSEDNSAHVAKKMKTNSEVGPKFVKRDCSDLMTTPGLKMSPVRSCKLPEPNSGVSSRSFDKLCNSTPFRVGNLIDSLDEDEACGHEASQNVGLIYSSSIINPIYSIGNEKKELKASPTWFMSSPPKSCVLMEPSDDSDPLKANLLDDKPLKEDEFEALSDVLNHKMTLEITPMWKEPQSTVCKRTRPGENTLKRELWVRFEAATTDDGLNLNLTFPRETDHKGFLDMLEEAS